MTFQDALSRATLWLDPPPLSQIDLRGNPTGPGAFPTGGATVCKFQLDQASGAAPKFRCVFAGGEVRQIADRGPCPTP